MPGKRHFNSLSNFPHPQSFENREKKKSWKRVKSYSEQSSGEEAVLVGVAATKEEGKTDWTKWRRRKKEKGFMTKTFSGRRRREVYHRRVPSSAELQPVAVKEREHGKLFYYPLLPRRRRRYNYHCTYTVQ